MKREWLQEFRPRRCRIGQEVKEEHRGNPGEGEGKRDPFLKFGLGISDLNLWVAGAVSAMVVVAMVVAAILGVVTICCAQIAFYSGRR